MRYDISLYRTLVYFKLFNNLTDSWYALGIFLLANYYLKFSWTITI